MPRDDLEEITNCDELEEKIGEYQAGGEHNANQERYFVDKAVELRCTDKIPDDFGLE